MKKRIKKIAAKGEKVDEKIQKNSHLIFDRDETLQNDFWIGKTFVDKNVKFDVKVNFAACTVVFDGYERSSKKIMKFQGEYKYSIQTQMYCQKRNDKPWHKGGVLCSIKSKTQLVKLLSQYLKEDGNTIANSKDDADTYIGGPASVVECEKDVTVFREGTYIFILFCTYQKRRWGKSSWKPTVISTTLKSWWISKRL